MARVRLIWQLFPSYLLVVLLALVSIDWYESHALRGFYLEQNQHFLTSVARVLQPQVEALLLSAGPGEVDAFVDRYGRAAEVRVTVVLQSGEVVGDVAEDPRVMESHDDRPEIIAALEGGQGVAIRHSDTIGVDMQYVALPLRSEDQVIGVVRVARSLNEIDAVLAGLFRRMLLGGAAVVLLAAVVSWFIAHRIMQPLHALKLAAQRFAEGNLNQKLDPPASEELAGVVDAMNLMAEQLDERIKTLARQRNEQDAMLSSMEEGVLAVDGALNVISINQAAARLLSLQAKRVHGQSIHTVIRNTQLQALVAQVLAEEHTVEQEIVIHTKGERIFQTRGTPLRDASGRRIGALIVLNDITELRRLEQVRREFVANVSHELKTPITSIKGFVETLQDGALDDPEAARRFLGIIGTQSERLHNIVEDLLMLSRLEQEQAETDGILEGSNLNSVVKSSVRYCAASAAEKNINFVSDLTDGLEARLNPALLEQAVVNLVNNAIKYSEVDSTIWIETGRAGEEIFVRVRDEGCGISSEHLPRLFERFYRVDRDRSRRQGGTGLGLAIVKHIVQIHGGRVDVSSKPGVGSTFSIYLQNKT